MSSLRQCVLLVALLSSNGAPSWFDPNPFIDPRHTKAVEDEYRAQIANMRVPTYEEAHTRAGQACARRRFFCSGGAIAVEEVARRLEPL